MTIPFSEYLKIDSENWSRLKHMDDGDGGTDPAFYRWRRENPPADKPEWVIGRALHTLVLEPDEFAERHPVATVKDRRSKAWTAFAAEHLDRDPLTINENEKAQAMASAVLAHPIASDILSFGEAETTIRWTDEASGIECKGRADHVRPGLFVDLKGTRGISPKDFAKSVSNYGYASQAAFYSDGLQAMTGEPRAFGIIAVESSAPWRVRIYEPDDEAMAEGRALYRRLLRRLAECRESGIWSNEPDIESISLPRWHRREIK